MIKDIKFEGRGCAISQANASQLTEMVINKPLIFVMNLSKGDIFEIMRLTNLGQARVKCALLSLKVLKMGVVRYYADSEPNLAKEFQNYSYNWHIISLC